jgi:hypothetical protein
MVLFSYAWEYTSAKISTEVRISNASFHPLPIAVARILI